MKYFLDTEFNGMGGKLISLALVGDDGREFYISTTCKSPVDWVAANVLPIVDCAGAQSVDLDPEDFGPAIASFLAEDPQPLIVADWPDDIKFFCEALITGPGEMAAIPRLQFVLARVDAYPTALQGAIQHNALWDARALRYVLGLKQTARALFNA